MSLYRLLYDLGGEKIERTKEGYRLRCLNPNHNDNNPSMYVNEAKGVFYCFGCGWGGTLTKLVSELLGVSLKEAKEVVEGYGIKVLPNGNKGAIHKNRIAVDVHELVKAPVEVVHYLVNVRKFPIHFLKQFNVGWTSYNNHYGIVFYYQVANNAVFSIRFISKSDSRYKVLHQGDLRLPYFIRGNSNVLVGVEGPFDALRVKQYFPDFHVFAFLGSLQITKRLFITQLQKKIGGPLLWLLDDDEGGKQHAKKILSLFPDSRIKFVSPDPDGASEEELSSAISSALEQF